MQEALIMKIIYYSPHPTHDIVSEVGYATHQREVILALQAMGHQVRPLIMGGTELSDLNPLTSDAYEVPSYKKLMKRFIPRFLWTTMNNYKLILHDRKAGKRLEEAILNDRPDLIYERSEYLQDSGARIASKHGLKYFIEVNAPFVEEMNAFEGYSLFHPRAHRIEAYKLRMASKVFCVSSALSDFLIKRYDCRKSKLVLQPNCINPSKYHTDPGTVSGIRERFQLKDCKVIGFVGSMFPYHGVDMLIEAFSAIVKNNPGVRLLVVGDGIVLNELKRMTKRLLIEDNVIFTGKIPHSEVFNYIQVMDICIMARSNWYGSPVKIFEYGLMKKPIIAPDTAPVRDVMAHMEDALITGDQTADLEAAIGLLLNDDALSARLAEHFHRKVLDNYTWDKAAIKIIDSCA